MNHTYDSVTSALNAIGLTGQQDRPDRLIVLAQHGPVWPDQGNSFWLSLQQNASYLSTWLPACYRIPANQDLVALCEACMKSGAKAMYQVPADIVSRFNLEPISESEFDRLFPLVGDET